MTNNRWQRLSVDAAGYTIESAFRVALIAVVEIFVARYLGPEGFGLLNYAAAVFALLIPLTLLGMRAILVREFSTQDDWQVILMSALGRQLPAALASSVIAFTLVAATRGFDREAMLIALMMIPLPFLATRESVRAYLEAAGRVRWIVATGMVAVVTGAVLRVAAIILAAQIWVFALVTTIEAAVLAAGLIGGLRGRSPLSAMRGQFDSVRARSLARESWPLLLSGFAVLLYMRSDVFMLGLLADDEATGIYVAAARISEVWYFIPMAVAAATRPHLARLYADRRDVDYNTLTQRFMTGSLVASLVAVAAVVMFGDQAIRALYGAQFAGAGSVLQIHIFAAPFVFLGLAAGQWFIDRGMTRFMMVRSVLGAVANIGLNLLLIPRHGAAGAAIATLVSYAIAGVFANAFQARTRPVFWMQLRAFTLRWN